MLLQRKYRHDPNGLRPPVVSGVVLKRLSADGKQKFTPKIIAQGEAEKWLRKQNGQIILITETGSAVFKVLQEPGRYCCFCKVKLVDDQLGEAARAHVAAEHAGQKSPDEENPSGYVMQNYYDCELEVQNG